MNMRHYLVVLAGLLLLCLDNSVLAQQSNRPLGSTPQGAYRSRSTGMTVNRTFGSAGRSPGGQMNSRIGSRFTGPTLGNSPSRNRSPVLSPYLNLVPGAAGSFGGQYLLRTQPFEAAKQRGDSADDQIGALRSQVEQNNSDNGAAAGAFSGTGLVPIRSGLTPTGHSAGFLNTGSYFPSRR